MTIAQVQLHCAQEPIPSEHRLQQPHEPQYISNAAFPASVVKLPRAEPGSAACVLNTQSTEDDDIMQQLFAENVAAKVWRVATRDLNNNVS